MTTPNAHTQNQTLIPDDAYFYLSWLVPLIGGILFTLASFTIAQSMSGWILWFGIYFYFGFKIVRNKDYLVIERFGEFSRIVHAGPRLLCFPGLIDKIADSGTLRYREMPLFSDDEEKEGENKKVYRVDFKDGSTPITAKASYRVGPQGTTIGELNEAIYRYTYTMQSDAEREERIEELLESGAIPQLQGLEIAQALVEKDTVADKVTADPKIRSAIEAIGVELNPQKGLIISDIALTPEIIAQRQKKLEGASEADKQSAQGLGYARTIQAIMTELKVSQAEARAIYETQRGLETLEKLKAHTSFVSPDIKGMLNMVGVGATNEKETQPST